jgi:ankyrin repeat protein
MRILSYDKESHTLQVELPGFPCYEFFDVPAETFDALRCSDSQTSYFNEHIWGSNFEHNAHWPSLTALLEHMGELFDPPVTVHSTTLDDDTPLHVACVWGDISAIDLLLAGGADVNARGDLNTTPLYNAVSFERVRCVERLLNAGATTDDPNELSFTARDKALMSGNPRLLSLFGEV